MQIISVTFFRFFQKLIQQSCYRAGYILCSFALLSATAAAETPAEQAYSEDEGWHLGLAVGAGVITNPVHNKENIPLFVVPRVEYFNGEFAWSNTELSWTPIQGSYGNLSLVTQLNEDGLYFIDEWSSASITTVISRPPGQAPGKPDNSFKRGDINATQTRHMSYLAGLHWSYQMGPWHVSASALQDVSGVHHGAEAELSGEYLWQRAQHQLGVGATLTYKNAELADYYYSVHTQDMRAGYSAFTASAALHQQLKVRYQYKLRENLRIISELSHRRLDQAVAASPLLERDAINAIFVGLAWDF